jgi:putative membrane protein
MTGKRSIGSELDTGELPDDAIRDHLANERTLLAWQRTALTVMGLGVVVDRVNFGTAAPPAGASLVGLLLIAMGAAVSAMGAYRFVKVERDIAAHRFRPALAAHLVLTAVIVAGGLALAIFVLVR